MTERTLNLRYVVSIPGECYFDPDIPQIGVCQAHLDGNPVPSLTHELCHADLDEIFTREGLRKHVELRSGKRYLGSVEHVLSPSKGVGLGECATYAKRIAYKSFLSETRQG